MEKPTYITFFKPDRQEKENCHKKNFTKCAKSWKYNQVKLAKDYEKTKELK